MWESQKPDIWNSFSLPLQDEMSTHLHLAFCLRRRLCWAASISPHCPLPFCLISRGKVRKQRTGGKRSSGFDSPSPPARPCVGSDCIPHWRPWAPLWWSSPIARVSSCSVTGNPLSLSTGRICDLFLTNTALQRWWWDVTPLIRLYCTRLCWPWKSQQSNCELHGEGYVAENYGWPLEP